MPEKLLIFLADLVIILIMLLTSIVLARKTYWEMAGLSKRQKRKRGKELPRIVLTIACVTTCAIALLLAFTIDVIVAIFFAVIAFLVIVLFHSASGRTGRYIGPNTSAYY